MSDLRVNLKNDTDRDTDHLDLVFTLPTNVMMRGYTTIQSFPTVQWIRGAREFHTEIVDKKGDVVYEANRSVRAIPQIRVYCDRLPRKMSIGMVFALCAFNPDAMKFLKPVPDGENTYYVGSPSDLKRVPPWIRARAHSIVVVGDYYVM